MKGWIPGICWKKILVWINDEIKEETREWGNEERKCRINLRGRNKGKRKGGMKRVRSKEGEIKENMARKGKLRKYNQGVNDKKKKQGKI